MKRDPRRLSPPVAFSALFVFLLPSLVASQEQRPEATFVETIDVDIVSVEVVVLRNGLPVTGLDRADFEIFDDRSPVEVTNFLESVDAASEPLVQGIPQTDGIEAPQRDYGSSAPELENAVVILVDDDLITPVNRGLILRRLRESLAPLEGSSVILVRKNQSLAVVEPFTTDLERVSEAIRRLETSAGQGGAAQARRNLLRLEEETRFSSLASAQGDLEELAFRRELAASEEEMLIRRSSRVLGAFFKGLAELPGRKAVIYVNDRFFLTEDTARDVEGLIAEAGASRVAIYPFVGDAQAAVDARGGLAVSAPAAVFRAQTGGLDLLANQTGGRVASSLSAVADAVGGVRRDLRSYYSLGFRSPHGGDGKSHSIVVKVRAPGVEVRHQASYVDKSPDLRAIDTLFSSLLLDAAPNELGIRARVGEVRRAKKKRFVVPVEIVIPLRSLTVMTEERKITGQISIFTMAVGGSGSRSEPKRATLPVRLELGGDLTSTAVASVQELVLDKGEHTIAVVVRDDLSGTRSGVRLTVTVEE